MSTRVFIGRFAHCPAFGEIEVLDDHALGVDECGKITFVCPKAEMPLSGEVEAVELGSTEFMIPGLIDTHVHGPQYAYTGTATDIPLLEWLPKYAFPSEERTADPEYAKSLYTSVIRKTLSHGTTCAMYFGTIYLEATKVFAELAESMGQRALIGKVCIDRNSPESYIETTQQALTDTEAFIRYVQDEKKMQLVKPVVTPRFVPSCTPELLKGLGELARKYDTHIQSHVCESVDVVKFLEEIHPEVNGRDTQIFEDCGLLTPKCVLAHAVHINEKEANVLKKHGTAISHCPLSNFFFANGILPTKFLVDNGNHVGLGTDMAGGYSPSVLFSGRQAVVASKVMDFPNENRNNPTLMKANGPNSIDYKHAFWLATAGGAQSLGMDDSLGTFAVGKSFDALRISPSYDFASSDDFPDVLQKFFNLADDRDIDEVWVQGVERKKSLPPPQRRQRKRV